MQIFPQFCYVNVQMLRRYAMLCIRTDKFLLVIDKVATQKITNISFLIQSLRNQGIFAKNNQKSSLVILTLYQGMETNLVSMKF